MYILEGEMFFLYNICEISYWMRVCRYCVLQMLCTNNITHFKSATICIIYQLTKIKKKKEIIPSHDLHSPVFIIHINRILS